jgi:hypothetical protein
MNKYDLRRERLRQKWQASESTHQEFCQTLNARTKTVTRDLFRKMLYGDVNISDDWAEAWNLDD